MAKSVHILSLNLWCVTNPPLLEGSSYEW